MAMMPVSFKGPTFLICIVVIVDVIEWCKDTIFLLNGKTNLDKNSLFILFCISKV
jgi:hypothetical protein